MNPRKKQHLKLNTEGGIVSEEEIVGNLMNQAFIDKIIRLKGTIKDQSHNTELRSTNTSVTSVTKFDLETVNDSFVGKVIKSLKSKSSSGYDGVSGSILKSVQDILRTPLAHIINTSIVTGKFPTPWKSAHVVPIHKKGDKMSTTNYRPVSLLAVSSKVLESVAQGQISTFCESNGLLPTGQHGFRKGRSTTTALVDLHDHIQLCLAEGLYVAVLIFDLSAAFDTLSSDTLNKKLRSMGFEEKTLGWIESFMCNRKQSVKVGQTLSQPVTVNTGVPQGSILSPLLYLLYVSDMPEQIDNSKVISFADDTTLIITARSVSELKKKAEKEAAKTLQYMGNNGLVANADKTGLLVIRPKAVKEEEPLSIKVGDSIVVESSSERVLGLQITSSLNWTDHIIKVQNNIRMKTCMMRQIATKLPGVDLSCVLHGLIMSTVRYGIALYGTLPNERGNLSGELQSLQVRINNAVRLLLGVKKIDQVPIKELLERANVLSVQQIYGQTLLNLVWTTLKFGMNQLNTYIKPKKREEEDITTRSQTRQDLDTHMCKRKLITKTACKIWNASPDNIRNSLSNTIPPKQLINNFVISKYYMSN